MQSAIAQGNVCVVQLRFFCCLWREERQRPHAQQQRTGKKKSLQRYPGKVTLQAPITTRSNPYGIYN